MQSIFPILRYYDARGAIKSLCASFGFVELFSVPASGPTVRHAQLQLGVNVSCSARSAGAKTTARPQDTDCGPREYHARDLEGHHWTLDTYLPAALVP